MYWNKNRPVKHKKVPRNKPTHTWSTSLWQGGQEHTWGKLSPFNKWCWENWISTCKRMKLPGNREEAWALVYMILGLEPSYKTISRHDWATLTYHHVPWIPQEGSVQFIRSVLSNFLWPPWNAARQASLSITNSRSSLRLSPWSPWCHPAISSSVVPFFSCPKSLPASESFPMSQPFTWGGKILEFQL